MVLALRAAGYSACQSSRSTNKKRDDELVDICHCDEAENGRMSDDVQCKNTSFFEWQDLVDMEKRDKGERKRRKVMFVNLTKMVSGRRQHKGMFALTFMRDYLQMLSIVKAAERLRRLKPHKPDANHHELFTLVDQLKRDGHK